MRPTSAAASTCWPRRPPRIRRPIPASWPRPPRPRTPAPSCGRSRSTDARRPTCSAPCISPTTASPPCRPAVKAGLDDAKIVALEVSDLSENATASVIAQSAPLVMFTDGRRLDHLLSTTEYDAVKSIIGRSGMPVDLAAVFKPWIVSMILSVSDCERDQGAEGRPRPRHEDRRDGQGARPARSSAWRPSRRSSRRSPPCPSSSRSTCCAPA